LRHDCRLASPATRLLYAIRARDPDRIGPKQVIGISEIRIGLRRHIRYIVMHSEEPDAGHTLKQPQCNPR